MKTLFLAALLCTTGALAATVPSTTTIAQGGSAGAYTLTAVVTGTASAAPSGTISFVDNDNAGQVLATVALIPSITTLATPITRTTPAASAQALAAGDFNGDGILDLAVSSSSANAVTILLGKGDGTFTTGATLSTAAAPLFVAAGRFGGQGGLDLAIANGSSVSIFQGTGDGTFTAGQTLALPGQASGLAAGSFGGAGLDLAATSAGFISVLPGNGDGTFGAAVNTAIAGHPGPVVAMSFGAAVADATGGTLTILLNAGGGTFTVKPALAAGAGGTASLAAGDFNGDGIADLAVASSTGGAVSIFTGDGSGAFTSAGAVIPAGQSPTSLIAADFNNDGITDLAIGSNLGGVITLLLGKGGGTFGSTVVATTAPPAALIAGDFDKEGHLDLAATVGGTVAVLLTQTQRTAIATATGIAPQGTGTHQVNASYPGDSTFTASASPSTGLVTTPIVLVVPASDTLTIDKVGDQTSDVIQLNSAGNFNGTVNMTCTVTFTGAGSGAVPPTCVIDPIVGVSPATPGTTTIALVSNVASAQPSPGSGRAFGALFLLALVPRLRRKKAWLLLSLAVMAMPSACGNANTTIGTLGTTPGPYRVDVTAKGTGFATTAPISLTINDQ